MVRSATQAVLPTGRVRERLARPCSYSASYDRVLKVLLGNGTNPNGVTKPGVETSGFMRDCRTNSAAQGSGRTHEVEALRAGRCRVGELIMAGRDLRGAFAARPSIQTRRQVGGTQDGEAEARCSAESEFKCA